MTYRDAAVVPIERSEPRTFRPNGAVDKCPMCGRKSAWYHEYTRKDCVNGPNEGRACQWWRFWCREKGMHLHQRCVTCGSSWVCGPMLEDR